MKLFARRQADAAEPEPPLVPGECECGHIRCCHKKGKDACTVAYPPDEEWPNGAICACKVYIFDPDSDDDEEDDLENQPTPDSSELERLYSQ